jgi:aryl-alcohol dehydrogenase-like predicted oxidoreductase
LRYYFEKYPRDAEKVVLTVKGAYNRGDGPTNTAEGIRSSVDYALKALGGSKAIDVFILARSVGSILFRISLMLYKDSTSSLRSNPQCRP